jgi:TolA-binding protein
MMLRLLFSLLIMSSTVACGLMSKKSKPSVALERRVKLTSIRQHRALDQEVKDLLRAHSAQDLSIKNETNNMSEEQIYADVIRAYRLRDLPTMQADVQRLKRHYPEALTLDNALYLLGQLHFKLTQYAEASKVFSEIIDNYSNGNKRAAAMLAKGQAYQKLRLYDLAGDTFRSIERDYPGSPESFQVGMELKLNEVEQMNQ